MEEHHEDDIQRWYHKNTQMEQKTNKAIDASNDMQSVVDNLTKKVEAKAEFTHPMIL